MFESVINVSFPRSGHHLLVDCIRDVVGPELRYCESYGHCRRVPCPSPSTNWQKTHDFGLAVPIDGTHRYIVQYRHPIDSIASWYRWELERGIRAEWNGTMATRILRRVPGWPALAVTVRPDTPARWGSFARDKLQFWRRFVDKWLLSTSDVDLLALPYDQLVSQPRVELGRVLGFVAPGLDVDSADLDRIDRRSIAPNPPRPSPHHDPVLLAELEESVAAELRSLGIQRRFT